MRKISPDLQEKLLSLVLSMGYEFVGYEFAQDNRRAIFRVYIDRPEGISVKDCSEVSRLIGAMLDIDESLSGQYHLEVSSPGIDRPLFDIPQYQKQVGHKVKVRLHTPILQKRNFIGVLQGVKQDEITLLLENGQQVALPFSDIEKGNVIAEISFKDAGQ